MKTFIRLSVFSFLLIITCCKGQQTEAFKRELKNGIEANKSLYIGKTINNLLANISFPVKSYMSSSFTGKTNDVVFYFITNAEVRQRKTRPIMMTVYFTEEKEINVIDAMLSRNQLSWTAEEKAFFGNLIVKDIYVGGNP